MEKYRKIEWNKELKAMREPERLKNQREKWKSISEEENIFNKPNEQKRAKKNTTTRRLECKNSFYENHKIFISVFLAIIAAASVIGIWNKYLGYLEVKDVWQNHCE